MQNAPGASSLQTVSLVHGVVHKPFGGPEPEISSFSRHVRPVVPHSVSLTHAWPSLPAPVPEDPPLPLLPPLPPLPPEPPLPPVPPITPPPASPSSSSSPPVASSSPHAVASEMPTSPSVNQARVLRIAEAS